MGRSQRGFLGGDFGVLGQHGISRQLWIFVIWGQKRSKIRELLLPFPGSVG